MQGLGPGDDSPGKTGAAKMGARPGLRPGRCAALFAWIAGGIVLALAGVTSGSAPAGAQPSFDCKKASTPVEKAICDDEFGLADLDAALGEMYSALRKALPKPEGARLRQTQAAWLRARNRACSGAWMADRLKAYNCLAPRYEERLLSLAGTLQKANITLAARNGKPPLAGAYRRKEQFFQGTVFVLEMPNGQVWVDISTVNGPTHHLCNLDFGNGRRYGRAVVLRGKEPDGDGKICEVVLTFVGNVVEVESNGGCRHWCGARGGFETSYRKQQGVQ